MEHNLPPIPKQSLGRTFVVAISLLSIIFLMQFGAVLWKSALSWPAHATQIERTLGAPNISQNAASTQGTTPTLLSTPSRENKVIEKLMRESVVKEQAGDIDGAFNLIEEADSLSATHPQPQVIARMALLYESVGQKQNAKAQWQRLLDLGPAAGDYAKQAQSKIQTLQNVAATKITDEDTGMRDDVGLQPGSMLGIVKCSFTEETPEQKTLHLAIKSRPGAKIDPRSVKIIVYFYEIVDGEVTLTRSTPHYKWITPPPQDWVENGIEILSVEYPMPHKISTDDPSEPQREYYGFVAQVYYKEQLQDFSALPVKLREQFPPKVNLHADDDDENPNH
ncbi:MAG: hypothetical protein ABI443_13980 [Chthoniobacterales bacterium]